MHSDPGSYGPPSIDPRARSQRSATLLALAASLGSLPSFSSARGRRPFRASDIPSAATSYRKINGVWVEVARV